MPRVNFHFEIELFGLADARTLLGNRVRARDSLVSPIDNVKAPRILKLYGLVYMLEVSMSILVSFLPEDPVGGLAAAGFTLIVAIGLIAVSLALGVAISLLIGLPALVTGPQRAIGPQLHRSAPE